LWGATLGDAHEVLDGFAVVGFPPHQGNGSGRVGGVAVFPVDDFLPTQQFEHRPGSDDHSHAGRHHAQVFPDGGNVTAALVVNEFTNNICFAHLFEQGEGVVDRQRDPRLLVVKPHHMHFVGDPRIRQPHKRHIDIPAQ